MTSNERATYQSLRARGFSHEVAFADALDGVTVDSIRDAARRGTLKAPAPSLPLHRTEAGWPSCSTCDGGGCLDCTDPA